MSSAPHQLSEEESPLLAQSRATIDPLPTQSSETQPTPPQPVEGTEHPTPPTTKEKYPSDQTLVNPLQESPSHVESQPARLQASAFDIIWVICFRVITIFILTSCLIFGAKKQVFRLNDDKFAISHQGISLPVDLQLAVFGLLNKLLDYLINDALFHLGGMTLTIWMACSHLGARPLDLQMQEELTKPWITVINFVTRWKLFGWAGIGMVGLLRYTASFATAMCVLLLGAGVNTIGIPKERWTDGVELWTDRTVIRAVEWGGLENVAYNMYLSFEGVQERARAMMAAEVWMATSGLWMAANNDGWVEVYQNKNGAWNKEFWNRTNVQKITGVRVDSTGVSSLSIHGNIVYDMWNEQVQNGSTNAQRSFGWSGSFNLTLPVGSVSCVEGKTNTNEGAITVSGSSIQDSGPAAITILFGASTAKSFPGATCTYTLNQGQYGVYSWIVSEKQPDVSIDRYGEDKYINLTFHDVHTENHVILGRVAEVFRDMIPNIDHLSPGGLVNHVVTVRDNLLRTGIASPKSTDGLALVVAVMIQHVLTMAEWEVVTLDPGKDLVRSSDVRYQVYGSGPRLVWQWAIAVVIVIALLLLIYDLYLTLMYRINIGLWLSLSGMMVAANYITRMPSITDGYIGAETETVQKTVYYVRKVRPGEAQLTDDPDCGAVLSKDEWFGGGKNSDSIDSQQV